MSHVMSELR